MAKYTSGRVYGRDIDMVKPIYNRVYTPWRHTHGENIYRTRHTQKNNIHTIETYTVKRT